MYLRSRVHQVTSVIRFFVENGLLLPQLHIGPVLVLDFKLLMVLVNLHVGAVPVRLNDAKYCMYINGYQSSEKKIDKAIYCVLTDFFLLPYNYDERSRETDQPNT